MNVFSLGVALVLLVPPRAFALDSDEFHLFGITPNGVAYDITPFGKESTTDGDPTSGNGIAGSFYVWQPFGDDKADPKAVGTCRVRNVETYTVSCELGRGKLAGTSYVGRKIEARSLKKIPDANKLYKAWAAKREYGDPVAYYRCTKGCSPSVPKSLIFIWYGD